MSTIITQRAANVSPPAQGEVYRIALTASSVAYNLPTTWKQKFITLRAVGGDMQYQFGFTGDTLALTLNQVASTSGGGPLDMTVSNASGATLQDGETVTFRLNGQTHFAVIGAAAAGYFELWLSENDGSV